MKTQNYPVQKRNGIPFLLLLLFVFVQTVSFAQTAATVYALVTFQKVEAGNGAEFEKIMKDNWKPLHQLRKQNGKITSWTLYRVLMTGASNEYNYVTVMYFDSFAKTEPNDNYLELMKAANPQGDAAAIMAKTQNLRSIQRQALYSRIDFTTPKAGAPPTKYVNIGFMKSKAGQDANYVKMERETFKKLHQTMADDGKLNGWGFWRLEMPAGTSNDHDYVTSNVYSAYEQMGTVDYEGVFKKTFPGKDIQPVIDETLKTRDIVKGDLWEFVMTLN